MMSATDKPPKTPKEPPAKPEKTPKELPKPQRLSSAMKSKKRLPAWGEVANLTTTY